MRSKHRTILILAIIVIAITGFRFVWISPLHLGLTEAVEYRSTLSLVMQFVLCFVLLIHMLYALSLYVLSGANQVLLHYSLLIVCGAVGVLATEDTFLFVNLSLSHIVAVKISMVSYTGVALLLPYTLSHMAAGRYSRTLRWLAGCCFLTALAVVVPAPPYPYAMLLATGCLAAVLLWSAALSIHMMRRADAIHKDGIFLLLACICVVPNMVWAFVAEQMNVDMIIYPFDLIMSVLFFAAYYFRILFKRRDESMRLVQKLKQRDSWTEERPHGSSDAFAASWTGAVNPQLTRAADSMVHDRLTPPIEESASAGPSGNLAPAVAETSHTWGEQARILAVDPDRLNLKIITDVLGNVGHEITPAASVEVALRHLEVECYDLVIADMMMDDLIRKVRERYLVSELPVLLLTSGNRSEDRLAFFQSGASDYLVKPIDAWDLRARVRAFTQLKQSAEERMRMECAWLQAQMQPHFLYNTLNSIAALATIDIVKMHDLLGHFSQYLRTSFDLHNTDRVVTLEHELTLVRSYLFIEKQRFGKRMEVKWELNADMGAKVPPLSIQTLVEHAMNHGILKRAGGGSIHIRIVEKKEGLNVTIFDNGPGIEGARLEQLLDMSSGTAEGIGLRNTDRRLKQLYDQGLVIHSTLGAGTTVSFHIPRSKLAQL